MVDVCCGSLPMYVGIDGGKCPGLGPSCFGLRVRTLPMFVGVVVVVSAL